MNVKELHASECVTSAQPGMPPALASKRTAYGILSCGRGRTIH
jgi:hypothetical protein